LIKGGKEGFSLKRLYNYGLTNKRGHYTENRDAGQEKKAPEKKAPEKKTTKYGAFHGRPERSAAVYAAKVVTGKTDGESGFFRDQGVRLE
jgi:hypothetical protein